jgi:hypothetical protein
MFFVVVVGPVKVGLVQMGLVQMGLVQMRLVQMAVEIIMVMAKGEHQQQKVLDRLLLGRAADSARSRSRD